MVAKTSDNIAGRLVAIATSVGRVEKKGFNAFHKYAFVREADLVDAVRPLLAEHSLWLRQTVTSHEYRDDLTIITMDFTWVATDTGETMGPDTFIGYGSDKGDKGVYKALTGTLKYFLMKTFLVSTGDDPEADENTDKRAEAKGAAAAPIIKAGTKAPVGKGGKQEKATEAQVREVLHLAKTAGISVSDIAALATKTLGATVVLGDNPKDALLGFLLGLSSKDIGSLILALATFDPTEDDVDLLLGMDERDAAPPQTDGVEYDSSDQ